MTTIRAGWSRLITRCCLGILLLLSTLGCQTLTQPDDASVSETLDATVRLEFRLVDTEMNAFEVLDSGEIPLNSELILTTDGTPVLVFREVIISDEHITEITSEVSQEGPAVRVELNRDGAQRMLEATQENIGRPVAAVVMREEGDSSRATVISVATIRAPFSERFEITGLTTKEAEDLASMMLGQRQDEVGRGM